jgi:hypothetical protein
MNLGLLDKSLQKQYPLYTRSGIIPPSRTVGNLGFTQSPFAEDVGQTLRFLQNRIAKPVANFTTQKVINPISDTLTGYFGYQDVDAAINPVKETNVSGTQALEGVGNFVTNVASKIGDVLVPTANKGEEETLKNLNNNYITTDIGEYRPPNSLMTNAQVVQQNKNNGLLNQDTETATTNQTTSLLNNQEGPSYPAKEGGYTYGQGTSNNAEDTEKRIKEAYKDAPTGDSPNTDAVPTETGNELTPTGSFMNRLTNFATSDFGKDFFANLLAESGPKVGKPQSFGSNIGKAYQKATDQQLERDQLKADKSKQSFAYLVRDSKNGNVYNAFYNDKGEIIVDVNGKKVPYNNQMFGADSRAEISTVSNLGAGDMTKSGFYKLRQEITDQENSLKQLSDYIADASKSPQGAEKLALKFETFLKTVGKQNKLSDEALNLAVVENRFFNLVGANRIDILGPGVLSEQDVRFIIQAIGGNPADIFTNKEVLVSTLSELLDRKYRSYETDYELYNDQATSGTFSKNRKVEKYEVPQETKDAIFAYGPVDPNTTDISLVEKMSIEQIDSLNLIDRSQEFIDAVNKRLDELGL